MEIFHSLTKLTLSIDNPTHKKMWITTYNIARSRNIVCGHSPLHNINTFKLYHIQLVGLLIYIIPAKSETILIMMIFFWIPACAGMTKEK